MLLKDRDVHERPATGSESRVLVSSSAPSGIDSSWHPVARPLQTVVVMRFGGCVKSLGLSLVFHTVLLAGAYGLGLSGLGCSSSACSPSCQQGFVPAARGCSCVLAADAGGLAQEVKTEARQEVAESVDRQVDLSPEGPSDIGIGDATDLAAPFVCDSKTCGPDQICVQDFGGVDAAADARSDQTKCFDIPVGCGGVPTCACIVSAFPSPNCSQSCTQTDRRFTCQGA
jgi:hypothetical protein